MSAEQSAETKLHAMRHSLAHIMANAIQHLWPEAEFGVGPVVEGGFYYDIDLGDTKLSDEYFADIEAEMRKIIKANEPFERFEMNIDEAIDWAKQRGQPYKLELLYDLKRSGTTEFSRLDELQLGIESDESKVEKVSFYRNGDFTDLCRGPHVESTGKVGAFKLMRVSGAYWRGDEHKPQMQRIYGVAFATEKELKEHLQMLEEAKKRDHRKLGQELDLFFFHEFAPGMPYWLPNGVTIYNELIKFWRDEHARRGYQEIVSPLLNKRELYITSGHFDHYWEEMFTTAETEEGEFYGMKAMNCPNAMVVFGSRQRSYRDLPLRLSDTDTLHRYERSGTLNGLLRVREFKQDDAHIFVTEEQIKEEYKRIFEITELFYSIFGMAYSFRLGTRPEKFMGEIKLWDKAEKILKEILDESGREYFIEEGDGAFYGPKIDIVMKDVLGRPWQMGTIQLDFQQPLNFKLEYTDNRGNLKTPIAIHRVIYGSLERFIGILIEHTAGKFPVWLAPEQVRLVTVNQEKSTVQFAERVAEQAKELGVRLTIDDSNESIGKKIRNAELMKVPYTAVIGEKEIESGELAPRIRQDLKSQEEEKSLSAEEFLKAVAHEAKSRASKSSL